MVSLILAGEAIYMLPYLRRGFQTSMQEVFEVSFTQLGWMNSMFGIIAITTYFAGGWISDRISTRKLLSFSLIATGIGGLYMATIPSLPMLFAIHAFWGVTTILTFWAALIKAARLWGGTNDQGFTFGLLDGGRGVVGGVLAGAATFVFARFGASSGDAASGLMAVILFYSVASILAGIFVLVFVAEEAPRKDTVTSRSLPPSWVEVIGVFRMPVIWLQALIIVCAYWLYVGTFEFAAFAETSFDQDKVFGAQVNTLREWMRPLAAIGAGLLADRVRATRAIGVAFVCAAIGFAVMAYIPREAGMLPMLWVQVAVTAIAVFALRGIYFALLEESNVPIALTGTAVGVISTFGYTPDFFAYPLVGWMIDTYGSLDGYVMYFTLLVGVAALGLVATMYLGYKDFGKLRAGESAVA